MILISKYNNDMYYFSSLPVESSNSGHGGLRGDDRIKRAGAVLNI